MHLRPGLCPEPALGAYQTPDALAGFKGIYLFIYEFTVEQNIQTNAQVEQVQKG